MVVVALITFEVLVVVLGERLIAGMWFVIGRFGDMPLWTDLQVMGSSSVGLLDKASFRNQKDRGFVAWTRVHPLPATR